MTGSDFISNYRTAVVDLLDARSRLKSYREMDTANHITAGLAAADFAGLNSDLTLEDIAAALAAMDSLEQTLTNFSVIPPVPTAALATLLKFRNRP